MSAGPAPFPWIPDPACGDWVRAGVDPEQFAVHVPWTIHTFVPRGFEAYARVLHPLERETDDGPEPVRWSEVAEAFGTTMTATANLDRLCRRPYSPNDDVVTPQGVTLEPPTEGSVPSELLARIARHLATHTTTPDRGVVGVWEGIGGLVSSAGRSFHTVRIPPRWLGVLLTPWRLVLKARRAWQDRALRPRRRGRRFVAGGAPPDPDVPAPGTGILEAEPAAGPRLELPYRSHILFTGGIDLFADRGWVHAAPWLDDTGRRQQDPRTPALWWPEDRAWFVANDVDDAWTLVAGSREMVAALVADPDLEALELSEGAAIQGPEPEAR